MSKDVVKEPVKETKKTESTELPTEEQTLPMIVAPEMVISFDRWFPTLGKPSHWKTGMKAYAQTSGKKTIAAWAELFKNY